MNEMTWVSIVILGPGAVAIFLWFLKDVKDLLKTLRKEGSKTHLND